MQNRIRKEKRAWTTIALCWGVLKLHYPLQLMSIAISSNIRLHLKQLCSMCVCVCVLDAAYGAPIGSELWGVGTAVHELLYDLLISNK